MREGAGEASGRKVFQAEETGSAKVLRQLKLRCQRDSEEYSVAGANTQKERGRRGFRGGTVKASRVLRTTGRNLDLYNHEEQSVPVSEQRSDDIITFQVGTGCLWLLEGGEGRNRGPAGTLMQVCRREMIFYRRRSC